MGFTFFHRDGLILLLEHNHVAVVWPYQIIKTRLKFDINSFGDVDTDEAGHCVDADADSTIAKNLDPYRASLSPHPSFSTSLLA
jgi:hypothetical protein